MLSVKIAPTKIFPSLFSPSIDLLIAGGGLSILFWLGLQGVGYHHRSDLAIQIAIFLSVFCNYPHYSATYYRVYGSWTEIKKYARTTIIFPIVLLFLVAASFLSRDLIAPQFVKLYMLSNGFHYSGQTYGISMIFARKAGMKLDWWHKLILCLAIYPSWLYPTLHAEIPGAKAQDFWGVMMPVLGVPNWTVDISKIFLVCGLFSYIILTAYLNFKKKIHLPLAMHLTVASQIIWFIVASGNSAFREFVPFFHCLQYLFITTYFQFKERVKAGALPEISVTNWIRSMDFAKYYLLQVVVGSTLFLLIPRILSAFSVTDYYTANAVIVAFLNLHHFALDGDIWKLRKPDVGKALIG